jgi:hypothetical protein
MFVYFIFGICIFLYILVIMLLWAGFLNYYDATVLRQKEESKHVSHLSEFKHVCN